MHKKRLQILTVIGCLSVLGQSLLTVHSHDSEVNIYLFIGIQFALFLFFLFGLRMAHQMTGARDIALIIGFAVAMRLVAFYGHPFYEDDFYRYLWDGKVWNHEINPYLYPPNDYFLSSLRDDNWENIGFKLIPTIYPPLSQMLFFLSYYLSPNNLFMLKALLLLFDMLTVGMIVLILQHMNKNRGLAIIYAWNPLVIKEFANSAHIDVLSVFMLSLFFFFSLKDHRGWAAISFGGAVLAKLYPLVLIPALIRFFRLRDFICLAIVISAGYAVFWEAEELLFQGLTTYAQHWEYNDSGFVLLSGLFSLFTTDPIWWSKAVVIACLGLLGLWKSQHVKLGGDALLHTSFVIIGSLLILAPTVDPWYITWIIPLLCIYPRPAWITLSGTAFIAYLFYLYNQDLWWIRVVEYTPFYGLLFWEIIQKVKNNPKLLKKEFSYEEHSITSSV